MESFFSWARIEFFSSAYSCTLNAPASKENEDLSVVVCTDYATGLYTLTGDDDDPVDEDLVGVESTDAIEDALLVKAFVKADD